MNIRGIVKKIDKKQIVFSVCYILIALFICFMLKKNYYHDYMLEWGQGQLSFENTEIGLKSEYFTFPAAMHKITVSYGSSVDTDMVIVGDSRELLRQTLPASEVNIVDCLYPVEEEVETYYIMFEGVSDEIFHVYKVDLIADKSFNNDGTAKTVMAFIGLILGLVFLLYLKNGWIRKEQLLPIVALTCFVFYVSSPCFFDYIENGHDIWCHLGRIEGIKESIKDGQNIAMIIPDTFNGFGILSFAYPQLFLYLPALMRLAGVSMPLAYHVFLFLLNTATAVIAYFSIKSIIRAIACEEDSESKIINVSLVAALFYLCMSYRLEDVYVRAANGEMLSMIFFPLVVAGLINIYTGDRKKWLMLPLGLTGIMQSHILSCCMVIILIIALIIPFVKQIFIEKRWKEILFSIGIFFLLNLWYIVPFVRFYMLPLNTDNLVNHYVSQDVAFIGDLFTADPHTSFADHQYFCKTIGTASLIALIISLLFLFSRLSDKKRFEDKSYVLMLVFSVTCFVSLILSSDLMPLEYIEENYPMIWSGVEILQFPYRLITIVSVCLVFMLAIALFRLSLLEKYLVPVMLSIVILSIYDSSCVIEGYKNAAQVVCKPYTGNFIQHLPGDYLPAQTTLESLENTEMYIENGAITDYHKDGTLLVFTYVADTDTVASVPLLYYPCYKVKDENGNKVSIFQNVDKRIGVMLPAGEHTISMYAKYSFFW